jgi:hypothetical protein
LHARPLHNNLVRESLKTVQELYENFQKLSESEVLHFRKLKQQHKVPKENEDSRLARYNRSRPNKHIFDSNPEHVNNIDSDDCGPHEKWEKLFGPLALEQKERAFDSRRDQYNKRGDQQG